MHTCANNFKIALCQLAELQKHGKQGTYALVAPMDSRAVAANLYETMFDY
jgi:hypothetical protein